LWNRHALGLEAIEMKRNRVLHLALDVVARTAGGDAARYVGGVGRVAGMGLFDHDQELHHVRLGLHASPHPVAPMRSRVISAAYATARANVVGLESGILLKDLLDRQAISEKVDDERRHSSRLAVERHELDLERLAVGIDVNDGSNGAANQILAWKIASQHNSSRVLESSPQRIKWITMEFQRITTNPCQMGGVPCLRGLRIPVATIVALVAEGQTTQDILALYPDLETEDLREALLFAAEAVRERVLPLTTSD
jgi:uncharacterized protein (DUF433 family)